MTKQTEDTDPFNLDGPLSEADRINAYEVWLQILAMSEPDSPMRQEAEEAISLFRGFAH